MCLRLKLIFRVHLVYVKCYLHFITLIPHKDFVRKIVLTTSQKMSSRLREVWSLALDPTANRHGTHLVQRWICWTPVFALSIILACHGGQIPEWGSQKYRKICFGFHNFAKGCLERNLILFTKTVEGRVPVVPVE